MGDPPGAAWLLAHEVRLLWRGSGGARRWLAAAGAAVLWSVLHAAAWSAMGKAPFTGLSGAGLALAGVGGWFALLLAISTAFGLGLGALFERGDLDLLLSAPIRPGKVFAVRGVAIAAGAIALPAFLLLPFAHVAAVRGHWAALAAYPLLAAAGLAAAATALGATVALVHALGVRRARTLSQVLGAIAGAALFLVAQLPTVLPGDRGEALAAWFRSLLEHGGVAMLLTWPARAFLGEPVALASATVLSVAAFAASVALVGRACAAGRLEAPAGSASPVAAIAGARPFVAGATRVIVLKELRLIVRDPRVVMQALLQVFYLVPLFAIALRRGALPELLAPAVIMVCAMLAGSLAWITVSGEEAPDLLGSAPVAAVRIRWLKVAVATLPAAVLAIPFLGWYAGQSALAFVAFLACLAGALGSSAVVQVWGARPAGVRDPMRRPRGSIVLNVAELASAVGWAGACAGLLAGSAWFVGGAAGGLVAPFVAWRMRRRDP